MAKHHNNQHQKKEHEKVSVETKVDGAEKTEKVVATSKAEVADIMNNAPAKEAHTVAHPNVEAQHPEQIEAAITEHKAQLMQPEVKKTEVKTEVKEEKKDGEAKKKTKTTTTTTETGKKERFKWFKRPTWLAGKFFGVSVAGVPVVYPKILSHIGKGLTMPIVEALEGVRDSKFHWDPRKWNFRPWKFAKTKEAFSKAFGWNFKGKSEDDMSSSYDNANQNTKGWNLNPLNVARHIGTRYLTGIASLPLRAKALGFHIMGRPQVLAAKKFWSGMWKNTKNALGAMATTITGSVYRPHRNKFNFEDNFKDHGPSFGPKTMDLTPSSEHKKAA